MRKAPLSRPSFYDCLTLSFAVLSRAQQSSLLPFLYQTQTLLYKPKLARSLHAATKYAEHHVRRTLPSSDFRLSSSDFQRPNNDPIAFVDSDKERIPSTLSHTESQTQDHPFRLSTLTYSEQAVFEKLIREASEPASLEPDEDILDQDEPIREYDPNVDLNSIFEAAIETMQNQAERAIEGALGRVPFDSLRRRAIDIPKEQQALGNMLVQRPLKLADANVTTLWNEVKTDEERDKLEVACDDHKTLVLRMLRKAKSDVEVWKILEKEVFSLISQLNENTKLMKKAKKKTALNAARVRKAAAVGKDVADVKLEKADLTKNEVSRMRLTDTKAIPMNMLLLILHRNYAEYCLTALRLFRRKHPTSFYALHVLPTIKRHGPISYVLGISTDLYNEVVFFQWTQYADLHGLADTMEEMLNQGIEGNVATVALIHGMSEQRRAEKHGSKGPVVRGWWFLRGTKEGWNRVRDFATRLQHEYASASLRHGDAAREASRAQEAEREEGELEAGKA